MTEPHDPAAAASPAGPLRSALAGDADFAPLLAAYVASVPAKREELAAAVAALNPDVGPLREAAHRLKGNAGGYGFPSVTDAAEAVVVACREGRVDDARAAAAALDGLLARIA